MTIYSISRCIYIYIYIYTYRYIHTYIHTYIIHIYIHTYSRVPNKCPRIGTALLILIYCICCSDNVPLQFVPLHKLVSNDSPWHMSPPNSGEGLLHNRVLDLFPPLQGLSHIDHIAQSLQFSCTIKNTR